MNPQTVEELRKAGYQIKIRHLRYGNHLDMKGMNPAQQHLCLSPEKELRAAAKVSMSPRGGCTEVFVTPPNHTGKPLAGVSYCHPKDNFDRKNGVKRALAIALGTFVREERKAKRNAPATTN